MQKVALQKSKTITDADKKKWKDCIVGELMSSEDSNEDGSFIVRPLPWRKEKVTFFLCGLDRKLERRKSRKSKIMTHERKKGPPSCRSRPKPTSIPSWCIN